MSDDTLHKWLFTTRKTICVLQSTDKTARDHINLVKSEKELDKNLVKNFYIRAKHTHLILVSIQDSMDYI